MSLYGIFLRDLEEISRYIFYLALYSKGQHFVRRSLEKQPFENSTKRILSKNKFFAMIGAQPGAPQAPAIVLAGVFYFQKTF